MKSQLVDQDTKRRLTDHLDTQSREVLIDQVIEQAKKATVLCQLLKEHQKERLNQLQTRSP